MNIRFVQVIAGALLVCGACVRFHPQSISAARTAADFDLRSLTNDGLRAFLETNGMTGPWPRPVWHLNDLVDVAFYYHPDLALARAQWASMSATQVTAGERPNPSVTITPGYDAQIPGAPSPWIIPLSFDMPIETAGKRRDRLDETRHLTEAAYWKWVGAVWQTRSAARTALLNFEISDQRRLLLDRQLSAQSNVVRLLQGQVGAGTASEFELTQARVAFDLTRLSRQDARRQYLQDRAQLASALGLPSIALAGARLAADDFESAPADLTRASVRQRALLERADIRGALAEFAASQSALQLAIAGQYPDIHLGPGYSWNSGSAGDSEWQLGLTVTLPLLNHNQGAVGEQMAKRRESAAGFLSVQSQAIAQIDSALAGYEGALTELHVAAELLTGLDQQLRSVRSMEQTGEVDPLALANAEVEYVTGALSRSDALFRAQQALGQLEDAMQNPLTLSDRAVRTAQARYEP